MGAHTQCAGPVEHPLRLRLKPTGGVVDIGELCGAGQEFVSRTAWSRDDQAIGGFGDGAHAALIQMEINLEPGCPDPSTSA